MTTPTGSSTSSLVNNNLANLLSSPTTQMSAAVSNSSSFLIDGFLGTAPTPSPSNNNQYNWLVPYYNFICKYFQNFKM